MGCCAQRNHDVIIKSIKSFKKIAKHNLNKQCENLRNRQFSFSDYPEFLKSSYSSGSSFKSDNQSEIPIDARIGNSNELLFL